MKENIPHMFRNFLVDKLSSVGIGVVLGRSVAYQQLKHLQDKYIEYFKTNPKEDFLPVKGNYLGSTRSFNKCESVPEPKSKKKKISKYLNKNWLKLRSEVFKRDNNKCRGCGSQKELRCHHEYYIRRRKIWEYPLNAFTTLCDKCHNEFHDKVKGRELVRKATDEEKKWYNSKFKKKLIPKPKKRNPRK